MNHDASLLLTHSSTSESKNVLLFRLVTHARDSRVLCILEKLNLHWADNGRH